MRTSREEVRERGLEGVAERSEETCQERQREKHAYLLNWTIQVNARL